MVIYIRASVFEHGIIFIWGTARESGSARHGCPFDESVAMESINSASCWVGLKSSDLFSSGPQNVLNFVQILDQSRHGCWKVPSFQQKAHAICQPESLRGLDECWQCWWVLQASAFYRRCILNGPCSEAKRWLCSCTAVWTITAKKKKKKKSWPSQVTVSFSQGTNWRQQLRRWHDLCSRPSISVSFKSEQTDMCLQLWEIHERCIGSPEGRIIPSQGFYSTVCIFETHKKQPTQVCNRYIWNYDPKIKMSVSHYEEFDAFSP